MMMENARENMLKQQIRACKVLDVLVLDTIAHTPRHEFVPEALVSLAYAEVAIPLPHGQEMLTPGVEASILQAVNIQKTDRVLEIGTGTGYMTALLAKLAAHVFSIDIFEEFTLSASQKLQYHGLLNTTLITNNAARGWREHAPYDVMVVTGSMPVLPEEFLQQLRPHGRLFAILGEAPAMSGVLFHRQSTRVEETVLFETVTPAILHAITPDKFEF